jgi:hypothetical protein
MRSLNTDIYINNDGHRSEETIAINMLDDMQNGIYPAMFKYTNCREQVVNGIRSFISTGVDAHYFKAKTFNENPLRTRVVFSQLARMGKSSSGKAYDYEYVLEQRETGLRIINMFEKELGFPLTRIYGCKTKGGGTISHVYVGTNKWMRSPYLLSLYILLLRAGTVPGLDKADSIDSFIKLIRGYDTNKLDGYSKQAGDVRYLCKSIPHVKRIFKHFEHLFCFRSMKDNYSYKVLKPELYASLEKDYVRYNKLFNDGILNLTEGIANDDELARRIKALPKNEMVVTMEKIQTSVQMDQTRGDIPESNTSYGYSVQSSGPA